MSRNEIKILSLHLQGTHICALASTKYSLCATLSKEVGGKEAPERKHEAALNYQQGLGNSLFKLKTIEVFGGTQPTGLTLILKRNSQCLHKIIIIEEVIGS